MANQNVTVVVLVMGDIGRSPRMQYHASSLLKEGFQVRLIGYKGSKPLEYLNSHSRCQIKYLSETPILDRSYIPFLIVYIFKILWQLLTLSWVLMTNRWPDYLLVQTPPAIPSLAVCWIFCRLVGAKFIIDWHNYSFTILALTHGKTHAIVKASEVFEGLFARRSDANLCVTKAMKDDLRKKWNISATTLYDRPPEHFGCLTDEERGTLIAKYPELSSAGLTDGDGKPRPDRPALLISSTSWTEDEDFSVLFAALQDYESSKRSGLPELLCVITGKGPLRERYMRSVAERRWLRVRVVPMWLDADDYPRLLACADLGVSLHTSSSGLDLPMKVVDMFGCGLPVAAINFPCLDELVQHNVNGLIFNDSTELSKQLEDWFQDFPSNDGLKRKFQKSIKEFQSLRWHDNWTIQALPLFLTTRGN